MFGGYLRCSPSACHCKSAVRYVSIPKIPNALFLSHVKAVSYCYHEDWRIICCGLFDLVMSGGCIWELYIQDLGSGPPYVYRLVCGVFMLMVITCSMTRVDFVGRRGIVVTYDGLLISRIPFLFDVLGVELLKLVRCYLGLSILYGVFAGVRIVKSGLLWLWCVNSWDSVYGFRALFGYDSALWGTLLVGSFLVC